jgi:2'-5' RNA ligase
MKQQRKKDRMVPRGKTHKSALVVIPPEKLWGGIQNIRGKHDKNFKRWMPHLTLLYPFCPKVVFPLARKALVPVCAEFEPFEITLDQVGTFKQQAGGLVVWVAPSDASRMEQLQEGLWKALPEYDDTRKYMGGFQPHLTLGQVRPNVGVKRIVRSIENSWKPVSFLVDRIHMIWRNDSPDDEFRIAESIPLGKV